MSGSKGDIIWASGFYLTEELPKDYDLLSDRGLVNRIEDTTSERYEDMEAHEVWELIELLAANRYTNDVSIITPIDITDKEFITEAFEIAFGDDAINRNFSKREVLEELMGFSKTMLLYDDDEEDIPDCLMSRNGEVDNART
tara:strand:- start:1173 stop:1598 length:426 start_codon:yes stop_codon:yes gene_type:complete